MTDLTPSELVDLVDGFADFLVRLPDGTWVPAVKATKDSRYSGTAKVYDWEMVRRMAALNDIQLPKLIGYASLREMVSMLNEHANRIN